MKNKHIAVVVTYNRYQLLSCAVTALACQTRSLDRIIIVDNASSDGTCQRLRDDGFLDRENVELLALSENSGGAGGFRSGLERAIACGAEWIWMMDDDALPEANAFSELMNLAVDSGNIYGSLAIHGDETSWPTNVIDPRLGVVRRVEDIPISAEVEIIPFLGFLVHRNLVERIGFPDAGFFIAADDAEYCIRASRAGARMIVAGRSHIKHPQANISTLRFFSREIIYLSLPAWKRYYDTRNRLLIARKYHGVKLFTQTVPGSFLRLFVALMKEPKKIAQAQAFFAGLIDGLRGAKGRRHEKWGIKP